MSKSGQKLVWGVLLILRRTELPFADRMVGQAGLEPATPRLSSACSNQLSYRPVIVTGRQWPVGGGKETRTPDILLAKQALYQLSYAPS